jgi:hypothetical protein
VVGDHAENLELAPMIDNPKVARTYWEREMS